MSEEKVNLILEAMQGITYLEWRKLRHCVDTRFDKDVSSVTNKLLLADAGTIVEDYRLEANESHSLNSGDKLVIADLSFIFY